jgi:Leucine-rich repeat (LRR) protein
LSLVQSNIKKLEAHVFDELVELKWIDLKGNEIEEILYPIFAKNKKLEYVDLSFNKIRSLHPFIFDGLSKLESVRFERNSTINKNFNHYNIEMMTVELKPLFYNFLRNYENRVRELELELELVSFFNSHNQPIIIQNVNPID